MNNGRIEGVICLHCHQLAESAGQLADSSTELEPKDGETCSQCGGFLYFPCYLAVICP